MFKTRIKDKIGYLLYLVDNLFIYFFIPPRSQGSVTRSEGKKSAIRRLPHTAHGLTDNPRLADVRVIDSGERVFAPPTQTARPIMLPWLPGTGTRL